jgi:hypothetical protein
MSSQQMHPPGAAWEIEEPALHAGGRKIRNRVPFSDAPVTMPSNRFPILDSGRSAAADFRTYRSTAGAA